VKKLMRSYLPRLAIHLLIVFSLTALCSFPVYPLSCETKNGIESWSIRGADIRRLADLPGECKFIYEGKYVIASLKEPLKMPNDQLYLTDYLSVNEITMQDVAYSLARDKHGDYLEVSFEYLQMTIRREAGGQLTDGDVRALKDAVSGGGYRSLSVAALSYTFLHVLTIWACCNLAWHVGKQVFIAIKG
jgi:hypothetical protein